MILPGTLYPWEQAEIHARVGGYLASVEVDIGDTVEAGDELARLEMPEIRAEFARATAIVAQAKAELELARLTRERLEGLRKSTPEAVTQQEVDVAAATEKIETAKLDIARAELARLRTMVGFGRLVAPFAGRVTRRELHPGALVRSGERDGGRPVLELARVDRLRVAIDLPESVAGRVIPNTPISLRLDAFPAEAIALKIARSSGALDPSTRTTRVEADLENPDERFQPGMYASVTLAGERLPAGLQLPSSAVRGNGKDRHVLVAIDGRVQEIPVVVGVDDGRHATIVEGLDLDHRVIVSAPASIRPGQRCVAVESEAPAAKGADPELPEPDAAHETTQPADGGENSSAAEAL